MAKKPTVAKKALGTAELNEAPAKVEKTPVSERELNLKAKKEKEEELKAEPVKASSGKDACDVVRGTEWVRRYTKEVHGADFLKVAEVMAGKDPKRSIVAPVSAVIVGWREAKVNPDTKMVEGYVQQERRFTDVNEALIFRNTVLNGVIKVARV